MKKITAGLLAFAGLMTSELGFDSREKNYTAKTDNSKYPFSVEEKDKLLTLEGKEKKQYIKELKEKYAKMKRGEK